MPTSLDVEFVRERVSVSGSELDAMQAGQPESERLSGCGAWLMLRKAAYERVVRRTPFLALRLRCCR